MSAEEKVITITAGSAFRAVLVLLLVYLLYTLRDVVLVMLTAVVIASAIEPMTQWLSRFRIKRMPAVIIIYLVGAFVLFGIFYLMLPPFLSEASSFLEKVPQYIGSLEFLQSLQQFNLDGTQEAIRGIQSVVSISDLVGNLATYITRIPGGAFNTVSAVFGGVFSFVLIVIFSFYLAVQEGGIESFLNIVTPHRHQEYVINLWQRSQRKIGLWMQGQLLLVLIIGILVYLGLTILGVKHAFLFAILAGVFELIPLFGPILASIPAVIVGFIDGGLTFALIIAGLYAIIQQFENHLIYPLVVNKVVGVPALLVILALIIGAEIAGFLGIILSVPIAAALMEFTNDIKSRNKRLSELKKS